MIESVTGRTRLAASARARLAERLRSLRQGSFEGVSVTQRQVAEAMSASGPLVSSWESPNGDAVPPQDRLESYAVLFCSPRSLDDGRLVLLDRSTLNPDEEQRRVVLLEELTALRAAAIGAQRQAERARSFWHFPDGQPVRLISSVLPAHEIDSQYTSPWHPNYIASLGYADMDAVVEAFGQIRAENPASDVAILRGDEVTAETLSAHVVILGGGDTLLESAHTASRTRSTTLAYYRRRLELPIFVGTQEGGDPEYDRRFEVATNERGEFDYLGTRRDPVPPRFLRDLVTDEPRTSPDGRPVLEYDVALIARQPNEMNLNTTVTICSGIFSRGTYGAVRAFTDPQLRAGNEEYLASTLDPDRFWLLTYVPVFLGQDGLQTLTPDLSRPMHVLRHSPTPST